MQEAKHSFNIKFRMQGFECQLTIRDEEEGTGKIVTAAQATARMLAGLAGVVPTNGNGKSPAPQSHEPEQPVCPHCGKSDELELVKFTRSGKPKEAYKCQRCQKWLPDKKQ